MIDAIDLQLQHSHQYYLEKNPNQLKYLMNMVVLLKEQCQNSNKQFQEIFTRLMTIVVAREYRLLEEKKATFQTNAQEISFLGDIERWESLCKSLSLQTTPSRVVINNNDLTLSSHLAKLRLERTRLCLN